MPSEDVEFEFIIRSRSGANFASSGTNQIKPEGDVKRLSFNYNSAAEAICHFHRVSDENDIIDYADVSAFDLLEIKQLTTSHSPDKQVLFIGEIYKIKTDLEGSRRDIVEITAYGFLRLLGERQINRIINNGKSDLIMTNINSIFESEITSSIAPLAGVEHLNLAGNIDGRMISVGFPGGIKLGKILRRPSSSTYDNWEWSINLPIQSNNIQRIWLPLLDVEDWNQGSSPLGLATSFGVSPIIVEFRFSSIRRNEDEEEIITPIPGSSGLLKTVSGASAIYKITRRFKEGWGNISQAGLLSNGSESGQMGIGAWNAFGISGGNTIERVIDPSLIASQQSIGDARTGGVLEMTWAGGPADLGIETTLPGALGIDDEQRSSSGRFAFSMRSHNFQTDFSAEIYLRNLENNIEILAAKLDFTSTGIINIVHGQGTTEVFNLLGLTAVGYSIYSFHFEFDLINLLFSVVMVSNKFNPVSRKKIGNFTCMNILSYKGSVPAKISKWKFFISGGMSPVHGPSISLGWINGNEIGLPGNTTRSTYAERVIIPDNGHFPSIKKGYKKIRILYATPTSSDFQPGDQIFSSLTNPWTGTIVSSEIVSGSIREIIYIDTSWKEDGIGLRTGGITLGPNNDTFVIGEQITGDQGADIEFISFGTSSNDIEYKIKTKAAVFTENLTGQLGGATATVTGSDLPIYDPLTQIESAAGVIGTLNLRPSSNSLIPGTRSHEFMRSTEEDAWSWAAIDFRNDPIILPVSLYNNEQFMSISIYMDDQSVVHEEVQLGSILEVYQKLSDNYTLSFSRPGFTSPGIGPIWHNLPSDLVSGGKSQPAFMIQYDNSWDTKVENRHFTVDYDRQVIQWNQGSGSLSPTVFYNRFTSPYAFSSVRYSQYINPEVDGIIRADRPMRLRDVLLQLLSLIDDPLNPGNPPSLRVRLVPGGTGDDELDDPGTGFDTEEFIVPLYVAKQTTVMDCFRDIGLKRKAIVRLEVKSTGITVVFEGVVPISDAVDWTKQILPVHQYVVSRHRETNLSKDEFAIVKDGKLGLDVSETFTHFLVKGKHPKMKAFLVVEDLIILLDKEIYRKSEVFNKEVSETDLWLYAEALKDLYGHENRTGDLQVAGSFPKLATGEFDMNAIIRVMDTDLINGLNTSGDGNVYRIESISYSGKTHETLLHLTNRGINRDIAQSELLNLKQSIAGVEIDDPGNDLDDYGTNRTVLSTPRLRDSILMALFSKGIELNTVGYRRVTAFIHGHSNQNLESYVGFFPEGVGTISTDSNFIDEIKLFHAQKGDEIFSYTYLFGSDVGIAIGDLVIQYSTMAVGTIVDIFESDVGGTTVPYVIIRRSANTIHENISFTLTGPAPHLDVGVNPANTVDTSVKVRFELLTNEGDLQLGLGVTPHEYPDGIYKSSVDTLYFVYNQVT